MNGRKGRRSASGDRRGKTTKSEERPRRTRLVPVLRVLGLFVTFSALVGPWWTLGIRGTGMAMPIEGRTDFGLWSAITTVTTPAGTTVSSADYDSFPASGGALRVTLLFLMAAIGLDLGGFWWAWRRGSFEVRSRMEILANIAGVVLAFVSAMYLFVALPAAATADSTSMHSPLSAPITFYGFTGTQTLGGPGLILGVSWGPGWAWYAALVGALFLILASAVSVPPQRNLTTTGRGGHREIGPYIGPEPAATSDRFPAMQAISPGAIPDRAHSRCSFANLKGQSRSFGERRYQSRIPGPCAWGDQEGPLRTES